MLFFLPAAVLLLMLFLFPLPGLAADAPSEEPTPTPFVPVRAGISYDDNQIVFGDSDGVPAKLVGVDTSFYNGSVDWRQLKKIGIDFAIIRVGGRGWGNGALYEDNWFRNALAGAQDAGIDTGVYFYSMAANRPEAKREALYVAELLDGTELELPVYMDMEFSGDYPSGRTDLLTTADRVDFALEFCETIEHAGYEAGVYASQSFFRDELNYDKLSCYSLWMANYTENNKRPPSLEKYDIWQLTDRALLPGVSGYCDLNVVFDGMKGTQPEEPEPAE